MKENTYGVGADLQGQEMLCPISTVSELLKSGRMAGAHHGDEARSRLLRSPPEQPSAAPS